MNLMVYNPVEEPREGLEKAMQVLSDFVGYVFAMSRHFPDYTVEEIWAASKRAQRYNREREPGDPICLWPTRECIEAALYHFDLHEVPESFPPLKLKRNERGELYLDF